MRIFAIIIAGVLSLVFLCHPANAENQVFSYRWQHQLIQTGDTKTEVLTKWGEPYLAQLVEVDNIWVFDNYSASSQTVFVEQWTYRDYNILINLIFYQDKLKQITWTRK